MTVSTEENRWHSEGLFSVHYLTQRLSAAGSTYWPDKNTSDAVFNQARDILIKNITGLRVGNEEDCEDRFITPMLRLLGFGYSNRRIIPGAELRLLPDYLLYTSPEIANIAFQKGTPEGYYAECLAILEAKRWNHNLSEEASGRGNAPRGRSPHYQIRDYLAETERLVWGILTNGAKWRLYCKRDRASSFFEFDLESILTQDRSSEDEVGARRQFRLFYALFRRAAFDRNPDGSCALDGVRLQAQRFQEEVERDLRNQVFQCVEILGRGFLYNQQNELIEDDLPTIYENTLILLYRILFVLNAEARELLPTRSTNERSRTYYYSYGLELVRRKLNDSNTASEYADDNTFQLNQRLNSLFSLINGQPQGKYDKNKDLDIPQYNGGLFAPERYPFLEQKHVADSFISEVLKLLCFSETTSGETIAFDYASLGERHLGSIYEGLLEYHFVVANGGLKLTNDKGERRTTGAYYTPEGWVSYIVEKTLQPLLERAEKAIPTSRANAEEVELDDSFAKEVLKLKICDPAMGSAHFLVEATTFLAEAVAAHPTTAPRARLNADGTFRLKSDGSGEPLYTQEAKLAYWKRRVVESCIYGVDVNPLAVELAKLSLWLKTVDRVPLNFLDHHLRCGNSLLGTHLADLPKFPGRKKTTKLGKELSLSVFTSSLAETLKQAIADITAIESVATDTHSAVKEKERLWREISESLMPRFRAQGDLWMVPWFDQTRLNWHDYEATFADEDLAKQRREECADILDPLRPFHWELEFPDIFYDEFGSAKDDPGFDAVIGNPPWERIKLQENEFFSARNPAIAQATRAADRKDQIAKLQKKNPKLWDEYGAARNRAENILDFVHRSGFYPLMGRGDTNYYAIFAEKSLQLVSSNGRVGLLVPSGIATDDTSKHFFQHLVENRLLTELLDFENREGIFEDVDSRFKFSIIRMSGAGEPQKEVHCGFFLHNMRELNDPERIFTLTPDDFRRFNPNTLTCPIFRRRQDAELTRKIYANVPILIEETKGEAGNPWGIQFSTMFHMTNDSRLFKRNQELEDEGFWLGEGTVYTKGTVKYLPLYEGKMVQLYDHRAASIIVNPQNLHRPAQEQITSITEYTNPSYCPMPQFWVNEEPVRQTHNKVILTLLAPCGIIAII